MIQHKYLSLCGESMITPFHACGFFDSREEQYQIMLPYINEGLEEGDRVINILERALHSDHCDCLSKAGISVQEKLESHQLEVLATEDTYLKNGGFETEKMLRLLEDALIEARNEGYESVRACGEMTWALKDVPGTDELIEYESRLNLITPNYGCSLVCMYDFNRFSGKAIIDIIKTHPYIILNGKIDKNPHYIPPQEFLPLLSGKRNYALRAGSYLE